MGMDLFGRNIDPDSDDVYYFRANVWRWRPIAEVIRATCKDILAPEEMRELGWNNGYEITGEKAELIGRRILGKLASGERIQFVSPGPEYPLDLAKLAEFAQFAILSGGFRIC